jgi:pimeloyl-ACP methyl ester carboxylesterase
MKSVYKSAEGERAVCERYLDILKHWPVPNQQLRVPTREGETFIVACGDQNAPPLLLLHGGIGEAGLSAPLRPALASDAHALWLDDVMQALSLIQASMVGVSLGGWLALDYATRRPERVESLAVLCPAGVGRQKIGIVFKTIPLRMLGRWGRQKAAELVLGKAPENPSPALRYFLDFMALIHKNLRPRMVKLPVFSDEALQRLTMPVMAIVGGKDVLMDSAETKRRLEHNVPQAEVHYLPEAGHFIPRQTEPILEFLLTHSVFRGTILRDA